jgi:hypothetical protein
MSPVVRLTPVMLATTTRRARASARSRSRRPAGPPRPPLAVVLAERDVSTLLEAELVDVYSTPDPGRAPGPSRSRGAPCARSSPTWPSSCSPGPLRLRPSPPARLIGAPHRMRFAELLLSLAASSGCTPEGGESDSCFGRRPSDRPAARSSIVVTRQKLMQGSQSASGRRLRSPDPAAIPALA